MAPNSTTPNNSKRRNFIKRKLRLTGRKQNWLAKQLNLSPIYLNYVLSGKKKPATLNNILTKAENILSK